MDLTTGCHVVIERLTQETISRFTNKQGGPTNEPFKKMYFHGLNYPEIVTYLTQVLKGLELVINDKCMRKRNEQGENCLIIMPGVCRLMTYDKKKSKFKPELDSTEIEQMQTCMRESAKIFLFFSTDHSGNLLNQHVHTSMHYFEKLSNTWYRFYSLFCESKCKGRFFKRDINNLTYFLEKTLGIPFKPRKTIKLDTPEIEVESPCGLVCVRVIEDLTEDNVMEFEGVYNPQKSGLYEYSRKVAQELEKKGCIVSSDVPYEVFMENLFIPVPVKK